MDRRHTVQKTMVLNAVYALKCHPTAEDIYFFIKQAHPTIGKGTVYRNLNILANEKEIKKIEIPNGSDCYDFNREDHYHVRCIKCNRISDVDMDSFDDMKERIHDSHGFQFLDYDILFKGICPSCLEENQ